MAFIPCPRCDTVHEIDQPLASLEGKRVRCAGCREIFVVDAGVTARQDKFGESPVLDDDLLAPLPPPLAEERRVPTKPSNTEYELEFKWDTPLHSPESEDVAAHAHPSPEENPLAATLIPPAAVKGREPGKRAPAAQKPGSARARRGGFSFPFLNMGSERPATPKPPVRAMVMAAGIATLAAIGISRHEIVRLMPQVAPVFDAIGLSVNIHGLEFGEIKSRIIMEGDVETLEITGTITNITREMRRVPTLRLSIQNVNGQDVFVWTASADKQDMDPGEVYRFRRRLASPPADAHHVMVRFVAKDDVIGSIR